MGWFLVLKHLVFGNWKRFISKNGFDEARIYIGDAEVETIEDPELPYEHELATYNYDNDEYDLSIELDAADEDTTISDSLEVTLENYLVTMETDRYFESLREFYDASYLFISDPERNVLREVDITDRTDEVLKLLPPEEIEGEAPEHYSLTLGSLDYNYGIDEEGFFISTDVGLKSWSRIYQGSGFSSGGTEDNKELHLKIENADDVESDFSYRFNHHFGAGGYTYREIQKMERR